MYHGGKMQELEGQVVGMKIPIVIAAMSTMLLALVLAFPLPLALAQIPAPGISNGNPSPQPQPQSQQQQFYKLNGISPSLHACITRWANATIKENDLIIALNLTQDAPLVHNSTNHLINMVEHCIIRNPTTITALRK
jgi:hypothetical protein